MTQAQTTAPTVGSISFVGGPRGGDTYVMGAEIQLNVGFSAPVNVTGQPQLALTIGTQTRQAAFLSINSSGNTLSFKYVVQSTDSDTNGISIGANALSLNGGTIKARDDGTTDADRTHDSKSDDSNHKVDGSQAPSVVSVTFSNSPDSGDTYRVGERISVRVRFNGPFTRTGALRLSINIGDETRQAILTGGGGNSIGFGYTVISTDLDEDGISIPANAIDPNDGTIKAADGTTDVDLMHTAVEADPNRKVDGISGSAPTVLQITWDKASYPPANGYNYIRDETIQMTVKFSASVVVTGTPRLALTFGSRTRYATYSGNPGNSSDVGFQYSVQSTDYDNDGVSVAVNALELNSGSIKLEADGTTDADLAHAAVAADADFRVNGRITTVASAPVVTGFAFPYSPDNGTAYVLGETLYVEIIFDQFVIYENIGPMRLKLMIGTQSREATFSFSDFPATRIEFEYSVKQSDVDTNGISIPANALSLNGGVIKAADDRATSADLRNDAVSDNPAHKVDADIVTAPTVHLVRWDKGFHPPANGDAYLSGERIRINIIFNRFVVVTGTPQLALIIGSQTRLAEYAGHRNSNFVPFDYIVQDSDYDSDGVSIPANAIRLNGGTIKLAANGTTDADLRHAAVPADPSFKVKAGTPPPPPPQPPVVKASMADVNGDGVMDEDDALVMYYAYALEDLLGDGSSSTSGVARFRQTLLGGRTSISNPSDADLVEMVRKANAWKGVGRQANGDINGDGTITADDALVMYYAYALGDLLGDGSSSASGVARFRETLLGGRVAAGTSPSDSNLLLMLRRANALRTAAGGI